jgi:23S rRNA (guanosine2251-2'-O)-methyltransferase
MPSLFLVIHNVRSAHNVGSMLRTADGLGVEKVYLSGYTPYPAQKDDARLPHIKTRVDAQINKTALGAQKTVSWEHQESLKDLVKILKGQGCKIVALEQTKNAKPLQKFMPSEKTAIAVGSEVGGLQPLALKLMDEQVQIPMLGSKESFNVAVAAAIALYHCKYSASTD